MAAELSVRKLFEAHEERLELSWIAGRAGADRAVKVSKTLNLPTALVGHLNLVRPHSVQVLGKSECEYLKRLEKPDREGVLSELFAATPWCVIVAAGLSAADELVERAEREQTPLVGSGSPSAKVVSDLQYYLSHVFAERTTVHGVFMEVMGAGVLVTGRAGVGKSELALELVSRGHRLIADDAPEFALVAPDTLEGTCPPALTDFMEVRGLGIVNVRALFGDSAVKPRKYLRLIVHLEGIEPEEIPAEDRLRGIHRTRDILGVEIPEVTLPVAPGHNMAVLVECTVRNHILRMKGYDSVEDFGEKQRSLIAKEGP